MGAVALIAALPVTALADDAYVDDDAPTDVPPCTLAQPCQSLQTGIFDADPGDTAFVDGGHYGPFPFLLSDGRSLIEQDFNPGDGDSEATIDGGPNVAIQVPTGSSAGTIRGFEIVSQATAVVLQGPATVIGNIFTDPDPNIHVSMEDGSGVSSITGNTFTDTPGDTDGQIGLSSIGTGSPTIADNDFENLRISLVETHDRGSHQRHGGPRDPAQRLPIPALEPAITPRALDATLACSGNVARRDIGADELVPAPPSCQPSALPSAKDTDPPQTTLTKKPKRRVKVAKRRKKVKLRFESDEPGSSFECLLERVRGGGKAGAAGAEFEPCTSPIKRRLRTGRKYEFRVRATDPAGNTDASPASHAWKLARKRR